MSSLLWIVLVFFLDTSGDGHFLRSPQSFVTAEACNKAAEAEADALKDKVMKVWAQCIRVPGETA
jgi:hypothetical protein